MVTFISSAFLFIGSKTVRDHITFKEFYDGNKEVKGKAAQVCIQCDKPVKNGTTLLMNFTTGDLTCRSCE